MPVKTKTKQTEVLPLEARAIQCIREFKAPKTTQDSVDTASAEYATANYLRQFAERRYEAAKRTITDQFSKEVDAVRSEAAETMTKDSLTLYGSDWALTLSANKPAVRVDTQELRTELVRRGVNVDLIDAAINTVSKKSTPALIIGAAPQVE